MNNVDTLESFKLYIINEQVISSYSQHIDHSLLDNSQKGEKFYPVFCQISCSSSEMLYFTTKVDRKHGLETDSLRYC